MEFVLEFVRNNWEQVAVGVLILAIAGGTTPWWTPLLRRMNLLQQNLLVAGVLILVFLGTLRWTPLLSSVPSWLDNDTEIELQMLAEDRLWLDGKTREGEVALSQSANKEVYTGIKWKVHVVDKKEKIINLKTLGEKPGSKWLDGNSEEGTVGLSELSKGAGIEWKVRVVDEEKRFIKLEAMNNTGDQKWLKGEYADRKVELTESEADSTEWIVVLR